MKSIIHSFLEYMTFLQEYGWLWYRFIRNGDATRTNTPMEKKIQNTMLVADTELFPLENGTKIYNKVLLVWTSCNN